MRRPTVSALGGRGRSFERGQRAPGGGHGRRAAEGDGLVVAGVAEGGAEGDRDLEAGKPFPDHFLAALRIFTGRGEVADDESLGAVEGAAEQELGEKTVDPVRRLVEVLEQDD